MNEARPGRTPDVTRQRCNKRSRHGPSRRELVSAFLCWEHRCRCRDHVSAEEEGQRPVEETRPCIMPPQVCASRHSGLRPRQLAYGQIAVEENGSMLEHRHGMLREVRRWDALDVRI